MSKIDAKAKLMESVKPVKHKVKFTDRFIILKNVNVISISEVRIDPMQIESYDNSINNGGTDTIYIRTKSGNDLYIRYINMNDFEKILNEWYNK